MKHKVVRSIAIASSLTLAGCSMGHTSEKSTEVPTTITTQPTQEQEAARASQLTSEGLQTLRDNFLKTGQLKVAKGTCVTWNTAGGETTVVRNPAVYMYNSTTEAFIFFAFVNVPDSNMDSLADVELMDGPWIYSKLDADGQYNPNAEIQQPFHFFAAPSQETPVQFETVQTKIDDTASWHLVDAQTGEPIVQTEVTSDTSQSALNKFCGFTAANGAGPTQVV